VEPPDKLEKGLRFGCGLIFGILAGILVALMWAGWSGRFILGGGLIGGLLCAICALRFGDRFWLALYRWNSPWPRSRWPW
jgi:hypothetical protein